MNHDRSAKVYEEMSDDEALNDLVRHLSRRKTNARYNHAARFTRYLEALVKLYAKSTDQRLYR